MEFIKKNKVATAVITVLIAALTALLNLMLSEAEVPATETPAAEAGPAAEVAPAAVGVPEDLAAEVLKSL